MTFNRVLLCGFIWSLCSVAWAADTACDVRCRSDQINCTNKLGGGVQQNCDDGYKLCAERCDPRRLNTSRNESIEEALRLREVHGEAPPQRTPLSACAENCQLANILCERSGNGSQECGLAMQACTERCTLN